MSFLPWLLLSEEGFSATGNSDCVPGQILRKAFISVTDPDLHGSAAETET